ncbi:MAG TPA: chromate efflux transporter [Sphingomonas sp.]|jgi:chromate transporter|uniref:chromate efflux transporter n=1 Tax=Sphingomonas sp. TaxID=28214 RepID=UPI002EDAEFA3
MDGIDRSPDRSDDADPRPPDMTHAGLFLRFLRFGALAFGGPVAQIAIIRRDLVDEERWISSHRFNRLLAVMQVLPGPEAHELCVHLGIRAKGRLGGVLAGLGFMLPGLVLMLLLAWAYTSLPVRGTAIDALFLGVQAAVIAVIVRAVHRIGEHILVDRRLWLIAAAAVGASLLGVSFWIVLPVSGASYALLASGRHLAAAALIALAGAAAILLASGQPVEAGALSDTAPSVAALFWAGLKGGLLTFGGAYTAIPFVRNDTVGRGWMTDAQFLDGLGLSGVLPAPLVIFATFVGYVSGGLAGALAITAGMFGPAFAFSLLFYERLEAVAEHEKLRGFLAGVAAGVVGLIAVTLLDLARTAAARTPGPLASAAIFTIGLVILYRWRSKLATPLVLGIGATIGAVALG